MIKEKKVLMTKLRFIQPYENKEKQKYITVCDEGDVKIILKIKLNMIKARANIKKKDSSELCRKCLKERETTEHILACYMGEGFKRKNYRILNG